MRKKHILYAWIAILMFFGVGAGSQEPLDADSLVLHPTNILGTDINPNLKNWIESVDGPDLMSMARKDFEKHIEKFDKVEQSYLKLKYANTHSLTTSEEVKDAKSKINLNSFLRKRVGKCHVLTPYVIEEVLLSPGVSTGESEELLKQLQVIGSRSCPLKRAISENYITKYVQSQDIHVLKALLKEVSSYRSDKYKQSTIERIYKILPKDNRSEFKKLLLELSEEYSSIQYKNWFNLEEEKENPEFITSEEDSSKNVDLMEEPLKSFYLSKEKARKRECSSSKEYLIRGLSYKSSKLSFEEITDSMWVVDRCIKLTSKSRIKYWKEMDELLSKNKYEYKYKEYVKRKIATIYWEVDRFKEAKSIILETIEEVKKDRVKEKAFMEGLLSLIAKIEANEGNYEQALSYYEYLVKHYPSSFAYYTHIKSLIHLSYKLKKYEECKKYLKIFIESLEKVDFDKRNNSDYTYALYWLAKIEYMDGNVDVARSIWTKLSMWYYSTFYGALAQYSIEKLDNLDLKNKNQDKNIVYHPGPYNSQNFSLNWYMSEFDKDETQLIQRGLELSKLGLKSDAECEFDEIDYKPSEKDASEKEKQKEYKRYTLKILLDYISGDWLSLVKNYDKLPRSFRSRLPIGFEKILFPIRYKESVDLYSKKLNLDPNIILAIIRQESLFNQKARSGVGATGVMQLMPKTALSEYKRIKKNSPDYIDKSNLNSDKRFSYRLKEDPDLNISLGVYHFNGLVNLYKNNIVHVLSAYNANPTALNKWLARYKGEDLLSFIEDIPYSETKTYIKLVMRNYFYYSRWYGTEFVENSYMDIFTNNFLKSK